MEHVKQMLLGSLLIGCIVLAVIALLYGASLMIVGGFVGARASIEALTMGATR